MSTSILYYSTSSIQPSPFHYSIISIVIIVYEKKTTNATSQPPPIDIVAHSTSSYSKPVWSKSILQHMKKKNVLHQRALSLSLLFAEKNPKENGKAMRTTLFFLQNYIPHFFMITPSVCICPSFSTFQKLQWNARRMLHTTTHKAALWASEKKNAQFLLLMYNLNALSIPSVCMSMS